MTFHNHAEEIAAALADHALRKIVHECLERQTAGFRMWAKRADPDLIADDLATYDTELQEYYEDHRPLVPFVTEWQVAQ